MMKKSMMLVGVLAFGLCRAAEESQPLLPPSLHLSLPAQALFNNALDFYEKVIIKHNFAQHEGLSGIFHEMFEVKAAAIAQDEAAQERAVEIYSCLLEDDVIKAMREDLSRAAEKGLLALKQLHVLAQKDTALKLNQMGYQLRVPEGNLNVVFGPEENESITAGLFECNKQFPYTRKSKDVVRGMSIANCYFAQQNMLLLDGGRE